MTLQKAQHKVLFNCTTNVVGGGAKNAFLFILKALDDNSFKWTFAVSFAVAQLLGKKDVELDSRFHLFDISPAKSTVARKKLKLLCFESNCKMVYTMAGPAYVKFPVRHIQGISNPYVTHADREAFFLKGEPVEILKQYLRTIYQFWFSRQADIFIFQSDMARDSYIIRGGAKREKTVVIPNAFDAGMKNHFQHQMVNTSLSEVPVIFCPGANYIHKAYQYIPTLAKKLKDRGNPKVLFLLTLKDDRLWRGIKSEARHLGVQDWIKNNGPFGYNEIIELYENADIVYVPSLLETFSASYLEAMASQKPLIVSSKEFARDVCGDYALYADPKNSLESAKAIEEVLAGYLPDKKLGDEILGKFGDQKQRFAKIIEILYQQA